jgi:pyruvate/2-oxoglutarate dehydrogenase complex dihydrolipoamide dehydrogenase (E3) component
VRTLDSQQQEQKRKKPTQTYARKDMTDWYTGKIRCQISHHDSATRYSTELGVEVFIGRASFTSARSVIVNGNRTLHFKKAVIATIMAGLKESYDKANFAKGDLENRPILMTNEPFLI